MSSDSIFSTIDLDSGRPLEATHIDLGVVATSQLMQHMRADFDVFEAEIRQMRQIKIEATHLINGKWKPRSRRRCRLVCVSRLGC